MNKGKSGERPSFSAREAKKRHDATMFKLRWHRNYAANTVGHPTATSIAALALADKLEACTPPQNPCLSGRVQSAYGRNNDGS
jgi:hypothetical protein